MGGVLTLIPLGRLVEEEHDILNVVDLELLLDSVFILNQRVSLRLAYIRRSPHMLVALQVHIRQENLHAPRTLTPQHVGFVLNAAPLLSEVVLCYRGLFRSFATVVDAKLSAQEIRVHLAKVGQRRLRHSLV